MWRRLGWILTRRLGLSSRSWPSSVRWLAIVRSHDRDFFSGCNCHFSRWLSSTRTRLLISCRLRLPMSSISSAMCSMSACSNRPLRNSSALWRVHSKKSSSYRSDWPTADWSSGDSIRASSLYPGQKIRIEDLLDGKRTLGGKPFAINGGPGHGHGEPHRLCVIYRSEEHTSELQSLR